MLKKYDSKDYPNLEITIHECIDEIVIINQWYQACLENIDWVEGEIKIFGKRCNNFFGKYSKKIDNNVNFRFNCKN